MKILNRKGYEVIIDDKDYQKVSKLKWFITPNLHVVSCLPVDYSYQGRYHTLIIKSTYKKSDGEIHTYINKYRRVWLHDFILGGKIPKGLVVDHINGNGLDNRKTNLRICTQAQNMRNRKLNKNNKIGFKGVRYRPNDNKSKPYSSRITIDGKVIFLGSYAFPEAAYAAYAQASKNYHGEFGRLI